MGPSQTVWRQLSGAVLRTVRPARLSGLVCPEAVVGVCPWLSEDRMELVWCAPLPARITQSMWHIWESISSQMTAPDFHQRRKKMIKLSAQMVTPSALHIVSCLGEEGSVVKYLTLDTSFLWLPAPWRMHSLSEWILFFSFEEQKYRFKNLCCVEQNSVKTPFQLWGRNCLLARLVAASWKTSAHALWVKSYLHVPLCEHC
jgi:hypothetical protein